MRLEHAQFLVLLRLRVQSYAITSKSRLLKQYHCSGFIGLPFATSSISIGFIVEKLQALKACPKIWLPPGNVNYIITKSILMVRYVECTSRTIVKTIKITPCQTFKVLNSSMHLHCFSFKQWTYEHWTKEYSTSEAFSAPTYKFLSFTASVISFFLAYSSRRKGIFDFEEFVEKMPIPVPHGLYMVLMAFFLCFFLFFSVFCFFLLLFSEWERKTPGKKQHQSRTLHNHWNLFSP